jgi:hypothetical protein
MIRREVVDPDGRQRWLLISQVEHARIAGEMAAAWRGPLVEPAAAHDELLAAIFHHDDGWAAWERSPGVDPRSGRPLDFTEMPTEESLAIWTASIEGAQRIGPLAAWVVSRHFCVLLEAGLRRQSSAAGDRPTAATAVQDDAQEFLSHQQRLQADWHCQLAERQGETAAGRLTERGLAWLQTFDYLSLWLCCREETEPLEVDLPDRQRLRCVPGAVGQIRIEPWPFASSTVELTATGREVAVARYPTRASLAQAPSIGRTLRWKLVPAVAGQ